MFLSEVHQNALSSQSRQASLRREAEKLDPESESSQPKKTRSTKPSISVEKMAKMMSAFEE